MLSTAFTSITPFKDSNVVECNGLIAVCVSVDTGLSKSLVLSTFPKPTSAFVVPWGFVPSSKFKAEWFVIIVGIVGKLFKLL